MLTLAEFPLLTVKELALCERLGQDPVVIAQLTCESDEEFLQLAGCSMAKDPAHPKKNWVTKVGGLPNYICRVARAIHRRGKSVSASIAIAVSRMRSWQHAKHPAPGTREKAAGGSAEWEAKKAKSHAMAHSATDLYDGGDGMSALDRVLAFAGESAPTGDDELWLSTHLELASTDDDDSDGDGEDKGSDKGESDDEDDDVASNPTYKKMVARGMSKAAAAKFVSKMAARNKGGAAKSGKAAASADTALERVVAFAEGSDNPFEERVELAQGWSDVARLHAQMERKLHRQEKSHRLGLEGEAVAREMHAKDTTKVLQKEMKQGPLGQHAAQYQSSHTQRMQEHAASLKQLKSDLRASNRQYAQDTKVTNNMPYPQVGGSLGEDTPEKAAQRGAVDRIVNSSMKKFHAAQKAAEETHALRLRKADEAHARRMGKVLATAAATPHHKAAVAKATTQERGGSTPVTPLSDKEMKSARGFAASLWESAIDTKAGAPPVMSSIQGGGKPRRVSAMRGPGGEAVGNREVIRS